MFPTMPKMNLHMINARHQLTGIAKWLSERLDDAFAVSAKHLPLLDTDVIMRAGKAVIPEKGHLGYAPERGADLRYRRPGKSSLADEPITVFGTYAGA